MKIAVLHSYLANQQSSLDQLGIIADAEDVLEALTALGHESLLVPFVLNDLGLTTKLLLDYQPDLVFNLVDEVDEVCELAYLPAAYLASLRIPYTGCNSTALAVTTDKVFSKKLLTSNGIDTPPWLVGELLPDQEDTKEEYLIKNRYLDSSIGLHEASLKLFALSNDLKTILKKDSRIFAEKYIDGREFNVSIYDRAGEPFIPSLVEIKFFDFPEGKLKVVGYLAKWQEDSFEYINTRHSFEFPPEDDLLLKKITEITKKCWDVFQLNSYARVDFRVDHNNRPWVLEVNGNPSISNSAGFALAAKRRMISYPQLINDIIDSAFRDTTRLE